MSSFIPNYYNNYYFQGYYNPFQQRDGHAYDREYFRPRPLHPSYYTPQPRYQTTFFANSAFSTTAFNQYGMNRPALGYPHQYDDRYRPQHTWPHVNKAHHRGWNQGDRALPLSSYSRPYTYGENEGPIYQYEKEVRYVPYPVFVGPGATGISSSRNLGYRNLAGSQFPALGNTTYPQLPNASQLPPKIRVIFIPPSSSFPQQQLCNGSLAMPPFSYNRVAQSLCSFPLPPPLPQISSLPLTLALQQRVMQQYANPVAVFPFAGGWPSPSMPISAPMLSQPPMMPMPPLSIPPMMSMPQPSFSQPYPMPQPSVPQPYPMPQPSFSQPFPMPQPSMIPVPPLPQLPMAPQPSLPTPQYGPSLPTPQYAPSLPTPQYASSLPTPQYAPSLPTPQYAPSLPTPQYAPYPATVAPALPYTLPTPSANIYPPPSYTNPAPFTSQAPAIDYPSMCRACIPAPPLLNVAVTGHCWIQHCSACHHVPADTSAPNARPANGRMTPLLRQPTALPNASYGRDPQQQYPYVNASPINPSGWSQLPPLPPGAVLISDEYIDRQDLNRTHHYSQGQSVQHPCVNNSVPRASTLPTYSIQKYQAGKHEGRNQQQKMPQANKRPVAHTNTSSAPSQASNRHHSSTSSSSSVSNSPNNTNSGQYDKNSAAKEGNTAAKQPSAIPGMVNLRYHHQTPDIQAIYHSNEQSRSEDSDETVPDVYRSGSSLFLRIRKSHSVQPPSVSLATPRGKKSREKSTVGRSSTSTSSKRTKPRTVTVHRHQQTSSLTNSADSVNLASETTNTDQDAISLASTTKTDWIDETKAAL